MPPCSHKPRSTEATSILTPGDSIVSKFGGSSVANAGQIKKVRDIVQADERRRYIVVSAPGRGSPSEQKVTDHLINIVTTGGHFREQRLSITESQSRKAVASLTDSSISIMALHQSMRQVDIQFTVEEQVSEQAVQPLHKRLIEPHDYGEAICAV